MIDTSTLDAINKTLYKLYMYATTYIVLFECLLQCYLWYQSSSAIEVERIEKRC